MCAHIQQKAISNVRTPEPQTAPTAIRISSLLGWRLHCQLLTFPSFHSPLLSPKLPQLFILSSKVKQKLWQFLSLPCLFGHPSVLGEEGRRRWSPRVGHGWQTQETKEMSTSFWSPLSTTSPSLHISWVLSLLLKALWSWNTFKDVLWLNFPLWTEHLSWKLMSHVQQPYVPPSAYQVPIR